MDGQKVRDAAIAGLLLVILVLAAVAAFRKPAACPCPPGCPNCCPCPKGYGQLTPQTRFTRVIVTDAEADLTWQGADGAWHRRCVPVAELERLCLAAESAAGE